MPSPRPMCAVPPSVRLTNLPTRLSIVALCFVVIANLASAEEIRVLSWNVESSGNDSTKISEHLTALQNDSEPYDLIALTEVKNSNASKYEDAVEVDSLDYKRFVSNTGGSDKMVILVRTDRFDLVNQNAVNLTSHEGVTFPGGSARRPMFVKLKDTEKKVSLNSMPAT